MSTAKRFEDLEVWKLAHRWVLKIYELTRHFPREELFGLTSQLRRAAISVPSNIDEGFGKRSAADKARFYNIAQGSLNECRYFLILARDLDYVETDGLLEQQSRISRMLSGYVRAMRVSTSNSQLPTSQIR